LQTEKLRNILAIVMAMAINKKQKAQFISALKGRNILTMGDSPLEINNG
jgi:hypothetical protein